mgnify:CR=1 FL=1
MKFSTLKEISQSKSITNVFDGYNHNLKISDGEFYDMENLTSSYYPVLSPRGRRGYKFGKLEANQAIINKGGLWRIVNGRIFFEENDMTPSGVTLLQSGFKSLVSMGAYLVIFPDKFFFNTQDYSDYGYLDASFDANQYVALTNCNEYGDDLDMVEYTEIYPSGDRGNPNMMDYLVYSWGRLFKWNWETSIWEETTSYMKITSTGIGEHFKVGDVVSIDLPLPEGSRSAYMVKDRTSCEILQKDSDYICIKGLVLRPNTSTSGVIKVNRSIPVMDFVIESGNRLWGCRYGEDKDGNMVNEIYASKLGDFTKWYEFKGIASDSYVASCGTDGAFTGAISYLGYPIFFKENCMHKVYGNYPSNYQIQTTECRGVCEGSYRSLAIVNEKLYYKSRGGICVYDGSLPTEISYALGNISYSEKAPTSDASGAVGGSHGNKYYISMESDNDGIWHLFAYDTSTNTWHKEDHTHVAQFCSVGNQLYFLEYNYGVGRLRTEFGREDGLFEEIDSDPVNWFAESGVVGTSIVEGRYSNQLVGKKYVNQMLVRMSLEPGSKVSFFIQYDSCGEWEYVTTVTGTKLRSFNTMIRPRRCDHFRIRIVGQGEAKIFSISKTIERGSDV